MQYSKVLLIFASVVKRKKTTGLRKIIYIILGVILILFASAGWKIYEDVFSPNVLLNEGETTFLIVHTGQDFESLAKNIDGKKVLRSTEGLRRLVKWFGYEKKIKSGRYKLTRDMGNLELIKLLVSGKQESFDVTFKYAERKTDLAAFWGNQLEADSNEILKILNDSSFAAKYDLTTENIISLFIPNTYNFYWNTSAFRLLDRMLDEYEKFWDTTRVKKLEALGLEKPEVSALASIVMKETVKQDEMPLVAGVYFNRLKKGMYLQADPTIIFAMNDKTIHRVGGKMLDIESQYNTYRKAGLPPGPICVPSVQAIDAVLNLLHHRYIYFCAKDDFSGYHNFAETFAQHQINAQKFQHQLNKRGVK